MNSNQRFHSLTALKGLLIFIIVLHNTFSIHPLFDAIPGTSFVRLFGGDLGDAVFYMLSGFLFSYSYHERINTQTISFKAFILRRLQKLFPLYIITNIAALILAVIQHGPSVMTIEKIVLTTLLQIGGGLQSGVPYNSPTWFVSALFVCYIVFYFICFYTKNKTQYICSIIVGIVWGYTLTQMNLSIPFCYPGNGLAFINFFIGCGLPEIYALINKKYYPRLQLIGLLVLLISFYGFLRYGVGIISGNFSVACSFVLSPIFIFLAISDGWISKTLQLKPLVFCGKISVSIFFWHMVIYDFLRILIGNDNWGEVHYLAYLLILLLCSVGSYKCIENRHR